MINAYDKVYLDDAQNSLAAMLDYAVYSLKYELKFFYEMFLGSNISKKFAYGDSAIIAGKSGVELARIVVEEHTGKECILPYNASFLKSPEYWTGWTLAYYQWNTGEDFAEINATLPIEDICAMYDKYHELDISRFVERANEIRMQQRCMTYLKKFRQNAGYSQSELSKITAIPVKTIQQYEQRQKDINKASFDYIIRLSKALNCAPDMLIERAL